jgi:glycerate 2-kinase
VKILVAPDSFKGTYSAHHVADAIADEIEDVGAVPIRQPAADGGEGTLAALRLAMETVTAPTVDPWGVAIDASYGLSPAGTAVVEVAAAGGYRSGKVGHPGAAVHASSYGTGVLIADAVCRGARQVIVAAGGSASTDGGLGAIQAIRDRGGMSRARMTVLTDVATTFGDAASVFAPQKGATPADVAVLTKRLVGLATTLPRNPSTIAGSGAGVWPGDCGLSLMPSCAREASMSWMCATSMSRWPRRRRSLSERAASTVKHSQAS